MKRNKETDGSSGPGLRSGSYGGQAISPYLLNAQTLHKVGRPVRTGCRAEDSILDIFFVISQESSLKISEVKIPCGTPTGFVSVVSHCTPARCAGL